MNLYLWSVRESTYMRTWRRTVIVMHVKIIKPTEMLRQNITLLVVGFCFWAAGGAYYYYYTTGLGA